MGEHASNCLIILLGIIAVTSTIITYQTIDETYDKANKLSGPAYTVLEQINMDHNGISYKKDMNLTLIYQECVNIHYQHLKKDGLSSLMKIMPQKTSIISRIYFIKNTQDYWKSYKEKEKIDAKIIEQAVPQSREVCLLLP
jgi:hypothetical protein|uniref:Uncharacterized protein n=1 Tax=viral metagenome TaxID=1070528 RepID=A0A6C0IUS9_9ZZZZ